MEELIKLAKEKGFQSIINSSVATDRLNMSLDDADYLWMCELQKWLREKHNIHVFIHYNTLTEKHRIEYITHIDKEIENEYSEFITHEQALEQALIEGLKLIKT